MARVLADLEADWIDLDRCWSLVDQSFRLRLIIQLRFLSTVDLQLTHFLVDLEPNRTWQLRVVLQRLLVKSVGVHFQEVYLVIESIRVEEQLAKFSNCVLPYRLENLVLLQVFFNIESRDSLVYWRVDFSDSRPSHGLAEHRLLLRKLVLWIVRRVGLRLWDASTFPFEEGLQRNLLQVHFCEVKVISI